MRNISTLAILVSDVSPLKIPPHHQNGPKMNFTKFAGAGGVSGNSTETWNFLAHAFLGGSPSFQRFLWYVGHRWIPRGNKRCFLNGVFQSGVFRGWSGSARAEGTKMLWNTGIFRHSLSLRTHIPLWQAEVRNLKTPLGKHRLEPLSELFAFSSSYPWKLTAKRKRRTRRTGPSEIAAGS